MSSDIEDAISLLEKHDCTKEVDFDDALEIVGRNKDWAKHLSDLYPDEHDIADLITFDNAHLVAQALTSNPEAARAIYNELHYWVSQNQI